MQYITKINKIIDKSGPLIIAGAFIALGLVSLASANIAPLIIGFLCLGLSVAIVWIIKRRNSSLTAVDPRFVLIVCCFNIIIVCLIYGYYINLYGVPYGYDGMDDDFYFDQLANNVFHEEDKISLKSTINEVLITSIKNRPANRADNYALVISWLYRGFSLLGFSPHTIDPRIINSFFLSIIALMVAIIAQLCGANREISRFSGYLCGTYPVMVVNAAHIYRDIIISFGIIGIVAVLVYYAYSLEGQPSQLSWPKRIFLLLSIGFCIGLLNFFRNIYAAVAIIVVLISMAILKPSWRIIWLIFIGAVILTLVLSSKSINISNLVSEDNISAWSYYQNRQIETESNINSFIFGLPYGLSLIFRIMVRNITPLPFSGTLITENYLRLGTVFWFFLLPFLAKALLFSASFRKSALCRRIQIVSITFAAFFLLNAMTTFQDRHIVTYIPLGCVLVSTGIGLDPRRLSKNILLMILIGVGTSALYGIIKFLW